MQVLCFCLFYIYILFLFLFCILYVFVFNLIFDVYLFFLFIYLLLLLLFYYYFNYLLISVLSFFQFAPYIYLFVTFVLSSRTHNSTQLTQSFASLPIISLYCTSLSLTLPYYLRMRIHITMINKIKSLQSTCTRIRRRI